MSITFQTATQSVIQGNYHYNNLNKNVFFFFTNKQISKEVVETAVKMILPQISLEVDKFLITLFLQV